MDIKQKIKNLPRTPGVYLMKDSTGSIIYVGKAKNLKNRVSQYFQSSKNHSPKVVKLVKNIKDLEHINTDTELEALLLERELIVKLQPPYNRQMKNPKGYCYIRVGIEEEYPGISISLEDCGDDSLYFGPYQSPGKVERAVKCLQEEMKLRRCTKMNNNHSSGCLNYHLSTCLGPCMKAVSPEEYREKISMIFEFLQGESTELLEGLVKAMNRASEELDFLRAAKLRDDLEALRHIGNKVKLAEASIKRRSIIAAEALGDHSIKVFFIRGNKLLGKESITQELIAEDLTSENLIGEKLTCGKLTCGKLTGKKLTSEKLSDGSSTLSKTIAEKALQYFNSKGNAEKIVKLTKQELDEQQIIFSYLSHNKGNLQYASLVPSNFKSSGFGSLIKKIGKLIGCVEAYREFSDK